MVTDEMLAKACNTLCLAIANDIPTVEEELHIFSPAFERKMRRLIRKVEHPVRYRFGQIAASFLLIVFLGFASLMAFSPTVRAAVVGWVKEQVGQFISHQYVGETSSENSETAYYISALPKGYVENLLTEMDGYLLALYSNADGDSIIFSYQSAKTADKVLFAPDNSILVETSVNGHPATLYLADNIAGGHTIVWSDDDAMTIFYITASLEEDNLVALAESVRKK